jgi:ADP-heptose:LPS heptosyltransferase
MFWLGVPHTHIPRAKLIAPPLANPPADAYVVIHPFASAPEKTWNAANFVAVAKHMQQSGLTPVILAGPTDDATLFSEFRVYRNAPLREVKSLMSEAQLFIGNDSGPAHIAAAFGIPVVVLFGPSNPVTWAPWRTEAQVLTSQQGMPGISVPQVIAATEALKVRA